MVVGASPPLGSPGKIGLFLMRFASFAAIKLRHHSISLLTTRQTRVRFGLCGTPFVLAQVINPRVRVVGELRAEHHVDLVRGIVGHLRAAAWFGLQLRFHPAPFVAVRMVCECLVRAAFAAEYHDYLLVAVPRSATQRR